MILNDVIKILDADVIYSDDPAILEKDYIDAFASDLMSDALALILDHNESTLLITGLANTQAIRTAEMLDLSVIVYVRGKVPNEEQIQTAKMSGIALLSVKHTMFQTCGLLYEAGLGRLND